MKKMTEEKLKEAIKNSISIAGTLKYMNMSVTTGNYKSFHRSIKMYNIDTTHFLGQSHLGGKEHITSKNIPLVNILVENSDYQSISTLKIRLVRDNIFNYECSNCGLINWDDKPISLQLDHINGIYNDHRIENLRFLCPNCHSQTETFAGRNAKKIEIVPGKPDHDFCACSNLKLKTSKVCKLCAARNREKIKWPSKSELQTMVDNNGYSKTGRALNVSPTSVKDRLARDAN